MPGLTLPIGSTNPKQGAVQWDARRIDGVKFLIPDAAGVSSAPVGSVVTLQEDTNGKQVIVLGAAAYADDEYNTYAIIAIGFLEAATQADSAVNQTVGSYVEGDYVCMISDVDAVAMVPYKTTDKPGVGTGNYVTPAGLLADSSSGNVAFPGTVWYGTPGIQNTGQLKTGYAFARIATVKVG